MLKRVVVCDSENRGKICMEEEDIGECRIRSSHLDKDTNTMSLYRGMVLHVPILDLPREWMHNEKGNTYFVRSR